MAYKKSSRFSIHRFITLAVIVLGGVGIGLTVFASQQQIQTESEAAGSGCRMKPKISQYKKSQDYSNYVNYYLQVENASSESCFRTLNYIIFDKHNLSSKWRFVYFQDGIKVTDDSANDPAWDVLFPQRKDKYRLKVIPPSSIKKGSYKFVMSTCRFKFGANNSFNIFTNKCTSKTLYYTVD